MLSYFLSVMYISYNKLLLKPLLSEKPSVFNSPSEKPFYTNYFTSLADLFTHTPSQLFWKASSHTLQLMFEGCPYAYPPMSIASYSCIQLSELEQCRVKKLDHTATCKSIATSAILCTVVTHLPCIGPCPPESSTGRCL